MMQFLKENNLLTYDLGPGVEAFSTERDAALPYPVIQGHQVHGSRVAVVDRPGMTREELEGYDAFVTNLPTSPGSPSVCGPPTACPCCSMTL